MHQILSISLSLAVVIALFISLRLKLVKENEERMLTYKHKILQLEDETKQIRSQLNTLDSYIKKVHDIVNGEKTS